MESLPIAVGTSALAVFLCTSTVVASSDLHLQAASPLVLILAGQSNMGGRGRTCDLANGATLPADVEYFEGTTRIEPETQEEFGPEVTLGRELAAAFPDRRIVLVKHAPGRTSLVDWAPERDPGPAGASRPGTSSPYSELLRIIEELDVRRNGELGGIFWMQGERDARLSEAGAHYFENFATLVAGLRHDLGCPDLPIFLGIVNPPSSGYPARRAVRQAQRTAARELPHVYAVDTDDLTKWDDDLHYDTDGILELGRRFANAFLQARPGADRPE